MNSRFRSAALAFVLLGSGAALAQPADLILRNGRIHTVDAASRTVQAVAIRDSRFTAVGTDGR